MNLSQQIEEIEREIALRNEVYPRLIANRKMRQSVADYHLERMRAVLKTLRWLRRHEAKIRKALAA